MFSITGIIYLVNSMSKGSVHVCTRTQAFLKHKPKAHACTHAQTHANRNTQIKNKTARDAKRGFEC